MEFDEVKQYLPQYLSDTASNSLFSELKSFPKNKGFYTHILRDNPIIYQGDGLSSLLHIELPSSKSKEVNGIVISNTCDIDQANSRMIPSRLLHSPILSLKKYTNLLMKLFVENGKKPKSKIDDHIDMVKKQKISQIFYLPKGSKLKEDSIIMFDRVSSLPSNYVKNDNIVNNRLFTLSDFGFYLFIFKLSIHYTRIRENVERGSI